MKTASLAPLPAAEIVGRLPSAAEIRARLDDIEAERRALMPLLRAARAAARLEPTAAINGEAVGHS